MVDTLYDSREGEMTLGAFVRAQIFPSGVEPTFDFRMRLLGSAQSFPALALAQAWTLMRHFLHKRSHRERFFVGGSLGWFFEGVFKS